MKTTQFEAVNLHLYIVHSFISTREGACTVCGLPGHLAGLMSIPGLTGLFCCVECAECCLFGPGRCRWCGFALDSDQGTFCCEKCRTVNDSSPFGSGRRFGLWFNRHHPRLYAELAGKEIPTGIACLVCGDNLQGKRHDSMFCCSNCRHRFKRSLYNPVNSKQGGYPGQEMSCTSHHSLAVGGLFGGRVAENVYTNMSTRPDSNLPGKVVGKCQL